MGRLQRILIIDYAIDLSDNDFLSAATTALVAQHGRVSQAWFNFSDLAAANYIKLVLEFYFHGDSAFLL